MKFQDFQKLRDTIQYDSFTPAQLILLFGALTGRICDREEFEPLKKEASDLEEVMVETLDRYEESQPYVYQPDPELTPVE